MELASLKTDDAKEARALGRAIDLADDFTLLLARCDSRARIREIQEGLTDRRVLKVEVPPGASSLLHLLEGSIPEGFDGAIYVDGLETWLSSDTNPHTVPFFLNLNASRDRLAADYPHPIVFWMPGYLLTALAEAAPDFFSVRSGYYSFISSGEALPPLCTVRSLSIRETEGLALLDKLERAKLLEGLLHPFDEGGGTVDPPLQAQLLTELGHINHALGKDQAALSNYQDAERINRLRLGDGHPDVARDLNNVAHLLHSLGDFDGALQKLQESERIVRVALGDDHPHVAFPLLNIGYALQAMGKDEDALAHYVEAERIARNAFGDDHPRVATIVNNIGTLLYTKGDLPGALACFVEADRIDRLIYGDDHPAVATGVNNIGSVLSAMGDLAGAQARYREAFAILIAKNGVQGWKTLTAARHLASVGGDPVAEARKVAPEHAEELAHTLSQEGG